MEFFRITVLASTFIGSLLVAPIANATLIPNPDGLTVYDTKLQVNWLANANLPGTKNDTFDGTLGVPGVMPGGSMNYDTALLWVSTLNGLYGGLGYLSHHHWTLPTTASTDPTCSSTGPHQNSFGFGCMQSALGSLYYLSLPSGDSFGFAYPDTTVPIPDNTVGPFNNFQPYLYWSKTGGGGNGFLSFSFNTGWEGSNVNRHYMYALPMIKGKVERPGISYYRFGSTDLHVSSDGKMVYDPDPVNDPKTGEKGVTWLADANLAKTHKFGAQCTHPDGTLCINPDGSMTHKTAENWIAGMNAHHHGAGWLDQTNWQLPPILTTDAGCSNDSRFGFGCKLSPMGDLYYNGLQLSQGTRVVTPPDLNLDGFNNLQPYLYWSCEGGQGERTCNGSLPAGGFSWSFSFGNGFQGTDVKGNGLYVMVYYPESPAQALDEAINEELGSKPHLLNLFLTEANPISLAQSYVTTYAALGVFIIEVTAQQGKALTAVEAGYLEALAQATADARGFKPPPPPPCSHRCI